MYIYSNIILLLLFYFILNKINLNKSIILNIIVIYCNIHIQCVLIRDVHLLKIDIRVKYTNINVWKYRLIIIY